jgi:lipopolysaccharide/colanic/teichoic acid biosynthesis glycosyltransferase
MTARSDTAAAVNVSTFRGGQPGDGVISDNVQPCSLESGWVTPPRGLPSEDQGGDPLERARGRYATLVKPVIDRVAATLLLIAAAPWMLLIAVAVAMRIGRPIIFRQQRVGQDGKLFTVYKFRTMTGDRRSQELAVEGDDRRVSHKRDDDPRLTPLGRVLRRWSADELPQLWNVIRGDMSIVGPRPELPSIVSRFEPWQHERHAVKPGLTGNWQVHARGDGQLMHERTDLDIAYVRSISLRTDVKILLLTIPAVLGLRKGF